MIPEGEQIAYECTNGHVNAKHKSRPAGHDVRAVCIDCGARLARTLVPVRECKDCGNEWAYLGDGDRPTCPECKGKATQPIAND